MVRLQFNIPDYMAGYGPAPFGMDVLYRRISLALATAHARAVEDEAKANAPTESGRLRASIRAYFAGRNLGVLEATAPYAKYLHEGTGMYGPKRKPIVIEPSGKKALNWPDAKHPVKATRPKGIKPNDFMRHAMLMYFPVLRAFAVGLRIRVLGIFERNYMNLREAGKYLRNKNEELKQKNQNELKPGTVDKYFHCKANCEAAQLGYLAESVLASILKEEFDLTIDNLYRAAISGGDLHTFKDSMQDMDANLKGLSRGAMAPSTPCSTSCSAYRPDWLPERLW
jgi:hypothetical protein